MLVVIDGFILYIVACFTSVLQSSEAFHSTFIIHNWSGKYSVLVTEWNEIHAT